MLPAQIKVRFPEFVNVPDAVVQAVIDDVAVEFDTRVWGKYLNKGMAYLVAHVLTLSPYGQQARIAAKAGSSTTYFQEYQRMLSVVATGCMVATGVRGTPFLCTSTSTWWVY